MFTSVVVDLGVGLAGRWVQAGGRAVDVLVFEVLHKIRLLERGDDARLCAGADDGHRVALLFELLELFGHVWARLGLFVELLNYLAQLSLDVVFQLLLGHGEAVLLLQAQHHAAEVLPDKLLEKALGRVVRVDAMLLEKLVGQVGAGFEGQTLALNEGVVAVEENVLNLETRATCESIAAFNGKL